MIDIIHRVGIKAPVSKVYAALSTIEAVEFTAHCSTKWATFLLSLRDLVETGKGRPAPNDILIGNWH
jgi:hypothetical protein